ncbi:MAG: MFS transporter [Microbacteriaceae bacterium]
MSTPSENTPTAEHTAHPPHWKRNIALFLGGQTASMFGSMLVQYAIIWYLTLETKSGLVLMLSTLFGMLPQAVISIFGGVWADRVNRKFLIIAADASIAVATLILAFVMLAGVVNLPLIFLVMAVRSAGAGIQTPAVSALTPQIVPTDQLMRFNGLMGAVQAAIMLLGPVAAGGVLALWSIVPIFFIDVVTAAIGIGLLLFIPVPKVERHDTEPMSYFDDLVEGVRYTFTHRFVRWLMMVWGLVFVLIVAPSNLTPLMIARSFGDEVWMLTANELAFGVGMALGGGVIAAWGGLKNRVAMVGISSLLFGFLSIALGLSTNLWIFLVFMFLVGIGVPFFSTPSMTLLQTRVDPERQGRVFGFVGIVMAVGMPLGMAVFGPLSDIWPVEQVLIWSGIVTFIVVALAFAVPAGREALRGGADEHAEDDAEQAAATTP